MKSREVEGRTVVGSVWELVEGRGYGDRGAGGVLRVGDMEGPETRATSMTWDLVKIMMGRVRRKVVTGF